MIKFSQFHRYPVRFFLVLIILFFQSNIYAKTLLQKFSFIPQWSPQAQFAGYYVAYEKGIYKKYGIDLEIIQGGPDHPSGMYLKDKKADFASIWLSGAIQLRSKGIKLINIAQIVQKSALILVAKKSSHINYPKDLNGKTVSIWGGDFSIQPRAFFEKYHIHAYIIPQGYSVNLFLRGGVDAISAMYYNEYNTIINSGVNPEELKLFFYYDYGLNFPEDGLYVLKETFEKYPRLSCAFVKASIEGWLYSFNHMDEAIDIVLKYMLQAGVPANRVHQKWMLERMKDLIIPDNNIGILKRSDYERVAKELKKVGLIKKIPLFQNFYKNCVK